MTKRQEKGKDRNNIDGKKTREGTKMKGDENTDEGNGIEKSDIKYMKINVD